MEKRKIGDYKRVEINFFPTIPPLKKVKDKTKIDIRYCVLSPYSFIHIYWDDKRYELIYEIEEPLLNEIEKNQMKQISYALKNLINFETLISKKREDLLDYIDLRFKVLAEEFGMSLSYDSYKRIYYYLIRDFIGFNETDALLRDYFIEDIECNGLKVPVYIVHRIYRSMRTSLVFKELEVLSDFVEKIAQRSGRYISYASPILDGSLPDGSRVNATYTKDITSKGPTFTIRKFTKVPWTPIELIKFKTLSPEMLAYFWLLIQFKMNILIVGGTSSGKTTLLNAISFFIPPEDRVVSIEDTRELNLLRDNWLPSVSRSATGVGKLGEISLYDLLRSSFRQNPDYVIVGETRGKEASVLFQGMASGHSSMSTIHADSVDTLMKRLETPPIELSPTLLNVLDSVAIMTHAIIKNQETRKLKSIVEIVNVDSKGIATTNTPFIWNPKDDRFYFKKSSKVFEKISRRNGLTLEEIEIMFLKRVKLLYELYKRKIFDFKKVQEIINEYNKRPQKVLEDYGIK